jgi:hypothetical protein
MKVKSVTERHYHRARDAANNRHRTAGGHGVRMRVIRGGPAFRVPRRCARAVAAGLIVLLSGVVPAGPASAAGPLQTTTLVAAAPDSPRPARGHATRQSHGKASVTLVVETVGPKTVRPKSRINVTGYVQNGSDQQISGLSVRLRWRSHPLTSRTELAQYAGAAAPVLPAVGTAKPLTGPFPAGGRMSWHLQATARQLGAIGFGVYPIAVEVVSAAGQPVVTQTTFLTFMPDAKNARPKPTGIAWVWPLLDRPRRTDDATFIDDRLEVDLAAGGRLDTLVSEARKSRTPVTWAIDPALLDDAREMTKGYTLKNAKQPKGTSRPKSKAAENWLNQVRTAGNPYFTTPYADPDAMALIRQKLARHLTVAYRNMKIAGEVLGRPPASGVCWPIGGAAGQQTLDSMAGNGCGTFLMSSDVLLPPDQSGAAGATTSLEAAGRNRRTLAYDATISDVVSADVTAPGAALLAEQRFLAETAMFTAEQPSRSRTLVIVPQRHWSPTPAFAGDLLTYSANAQWLKAVPLSAIEKATPTQRTFTGYPAGLERHELGATYLKNVRDVATAAVRFSNIFDPPANAYELAVLRMESAWWRGRDRQARAFRQTVDSALDGAISQVHLVTNKRIGLAGNSGFIPITVANDLKNRSVGVVLRVTTQNPRRLMIGGGTRVENGSGREWYLKIGPERKETVRIPVEANANGYTDLSLELLAPQPRRKFGQDRFITVHTTGYGRMALLITGGGLAVLFLGVGARVLRVRRRREAEESDGTGTAAVAGEHPGD